MYKIDGLLVFKEEDSYNDGCLPNTATSDYFANTFIGETQKEVIKQVCDFLSIDLESVEINACDEDGRIDFSRIEDKESCNMTKGQILAWKQGLIKAWYACYTGIMVEYTEKQVKIDKLD